MKVLSLFSGVGGFDLGLEAAGMQTIYQCEWDKHATNILNRHWPHVPKWGDITTLTAQEILRHGQQPDVVAWGSPCQDLSVAGKRAGLSGERSGLFHEGIRLIKELRKETNNEYPRISIWENVAGAMSSNGGADFGEVLNEMAEAGAMVIEWAILDAQHFGVPQRRRRVFVIAIFDPAIANRCPDPLLPVSESLRGNPAKGRKKRQATSSETSAGFGSGSFGGWSETDTAITLSARDHKSSNTIAVEPILIDRAAFNQGQNAQYQIHISDEPVTPSLVAKGPHAVAFSIREDAKANTFSATELDHANSLSSVWPSPQSHHAQMFITEPIQYDGYNQRIYNDGISTTIRIGRDSSDFIVPKPAVEMAVRRLTPVECERLMGWPDNWTDGQSDTHRYKQCGNGVASPVAKWIAQHLLNI